MTDKKSTIIHIATEHHIMDPTLADGWEGIRITTWMQAQHDYGRAAGEYTGMCTAAKLLEDKAVEFFKAGKDDRAREYRELAKILRDKADEFRKRIEDAVKASLTHDATLALDPPMNKAKTK